MNKTININLANTFFHIDEEAYGRLRRYLESIRRSFSGTAGSDEIIADIEARIAELFSEKMEHDRQVITQKEVDHVIQIMGQPEDYLVDEDIFEDDPKRGSSASAASRKVKKLYRDTENKYIAGVCAGLEHYLGFDALWIRIILVALAVLGSGFGIIAYIILWILVPEANSTSQKLDMRGEPINISNIERKVKEGFDDVASRVKNVDYDKVGNKVKSGSKTFFETIGDIFMFLFKIFGKFIAILMIIIGATTLVGLFVGMFTVGVLDLGPLSDFARMDLFNTTGAPLWLVSILGFFAIGIPFFFLLYLGLKILVNNLKSIGNVAKYSLLGLWLLSVGTLAALGIKQAASQAFTATDTVDHSLHGLAGIDTLTISIEGSEDYEEQNGFSFDDMEVLHDKNGNEKLYSNDVRVRLAISKDSLFSLKVKKDADGYSFQDARDRAAEIEYGYRQEGNTLILHNFLVTDTKNKVRNQEVRPTLYIPSGQVIRFGKSTARNLSWNIENDHDLNRSEIIEHTWTMGKDGVLRCLDCESLEEDLEDAEGHLKIDEDGVDINIQGKDKSLEIKVDENGVKIDAN